MKRLTISMSDELFDKLDKIENKSLFIRKLIERELDVLDNIPANEKTPWKERFAILQDDVDMIFTRLKDLEYKIQMEEGVGGKLNTLPDIGNMQETVQGSLETSDTILPQRCMNSPEEHTGSDTIEDTEENDSKTKTDVLVFEQELSQPVKESHAETEPAVEVFELLPDSIMKNVIEPDFQTTEEIASQTVENPQGIKLSEIVAEKIDQKEAPPEENTSSDPIKRTIETPAEMIEYTIPEFKPPAKERKEEGVVIPELKTPVQERKEEGVVIPELKTPVQERKEEGVVIPELKPPVQERKEEGVVIPELKTPVQERKEEGVVMPELKTPVQERKEEGVVMPEFSQIGIESEPELSQFKPSEMQNTENPAVLPLFMDTEESNMQQIQETSVKSAVHSPDVAPSRNENIKPDKLETNILMYMPRGAKVKKDIIKSLVSRQFNHEEINMKIRDLVAREVLVLRMENGTEHLHRLK
ncbi:MAG: hypothetical protein QCH31_06615 [Methanolobus sp.]|nr:hypothetical protein [Methanolobus sp.]